MSKKMLMVLCGLMLAAMQPVAAQSKPAEAAVQSQYDAELAKSLGGDDQGMRSYVLVILKTGPNKVTDKAERAKMFEGHFANINKLAAEKKLAVAGPLDGKEGRRGIFILATSDIPQAKTYVDADPVIVSGEMVAEYHQFYSSAALMGVNDTHNKIQKKK
ncbi:YciI family protein [Telluria aromaticivorans]|uniref:YCII-related domain-containing protein n=1 Tax=Telluria aromaticivorans TaxID=2725995 RepID=A0A7Y2JWC9_9BURK|nr:hypothetical protein [Telluria aromaticivorans]NNG22245.1 hypothetical protein [Telluria aromaticivorans]